MKKRFTEAQITFALRQADSGTSIGDNVADYPPNILHYIHYNTTLGPRTLIISEGIFDK